ncbi:MAG: hypothetical protein EHM28_10070 [Spirochaetaceae bacterium]|nr:MAG: hypothetical protein EHM28_10070 [Spirochaetaceae bacterium]
MKAIVKLATHIAVLSVLTSCSDMLADLGQNTPSPTPVPAPDSGAVYFFELDAGSMWMQTTVLHALEMGIEGNTRAFPLPWKGIRQLQASLMQW